MNKAKEFLLLSYFEDLQEHESFLSRRMFGGLAIYFNGLLVSVLMESPGEKSYRGKNFNFDIWDGIMIPTSREFHILLQKDLPDLVQHPVLGKWLYLPQQTEHFEESLSQVITLIKRRNYRIGIIPAQKKVKAMPPIKKIVKKTKPTIRKNKLKN